MVEMVFDVAGGDGGGVAAGLPIEAAQNDAIGLEGGWGVGVLFKLPGYDFPVAGPIQFSGCERDDLVVSAVPGTGVSGAA